CSVLALDADTGKLRWHFQFTPHDTHDWDAQSWPVLLDMTFQGRPRKLLVHPNRNGFFYVLDRTTGEFLRATPFIDRLNWAKGVDPSKSDRGRFYLRAIDPKTGKRQWEYPMTGDGRNRPGTLSTAGAVIFFGDDMGQLVALDANTGQHLWHFGTGQVLSAAPV